MNSKNQTHSDLDPFGEEDWDDDEIFFAFVDTLEVLENERYFIQFDCIKTSQFINYPKFILNTKDFESLSPVLIVCEFEQDVYQSFISQFQVEFNEGIWLILKISDNPNQFRVNLIPEYFESVPDPIIRYLGTGCQATSPQENRRLRRIFRIKTTHEESLNNLQKLLDNQPAKLKFPMDVAVYNVGQGNLNAILDNKGIPLVYYDVGGGAYWNAFTYPNPNPLKLCFTNDPIIILSHWDFDHWWTFNKLIRKKLLPENCVTTWIVPKQYLGPIQIKFYDLLKVNGHRIIVWSYKLKPKIDYLFRHIGRIIKCNGSTKNDSGLSLIVESYQFRILLPGDASYRYIKRSYKGQFSGLVTTHHGGKSHDVLTDFPKPISSSGKIVYSYGLNNRYQHPKGVTFMKHWQVGWNIIKGTHGGSVSFMLINTRNALCKNICDLHIQQVF